MTIVSELERELFEMAQRHAVTPAKRGRRRSRRGGLVVALAVVVVAGAALAATGVIPIGKPQPRLGPEPTPDAGTGVVLAGTPRLTAVRAADPDGGPAWGLRLVRTSRGLGCLQVGRVVDGQLGAIGEDDVSHNDGKFHAFSTSQLDPWACGSLDANDRLFTNGSVVGVPKAATSQGACVTPGFFTGTPKPRACAWRDERAVYYGVLGPRLQTVTYLDAGRSHTINASPPYGAYLVVVRDTDHHCNCASGGQLGPTGSPITQVRFTTGGTCRVGQAGFIGHCPIPGYQPVVAKPVTAAQLHTRIDAHLVHHGHHLELVVSFPAPIAITNARTAYSVSSHNQAHTAHKQFAIATINRNLHKGQLATAKFFVTPGLHTGIVRYIPNATPLGLGKNAIVIGHWGYRVP